MFLPVTVATVLLLASLLTYAVALHLIVRTVSTLIRRGYGGSGFWESTAIMASVTLITAAAHMFEITLWAVAVLLCGLVSNLETALYYSAQNYTALGYGDVQLPERWRMLGPLEAIAGLLLVGVSTAVLFAVLTHVISKRLREIDSQDQRAANQKPHSVGGEARSN